MRPADDDDRSVAGTLMMQMIIITLLARPPHEDFNQNGMWDVFGSLKGKRKYAPIVCCGLKQHRRAKANSKPVVIHPNT